MSDYAIVDVLGTILNVIEWDGVSVYPVPIGTTLVLSDGTAQPGGTYSKGVFAPPAPTETDPPPYISPIVALTTVLVQQGVLTADQVNQAMQGTQQASAISTSLSAIAPFNGALNNTSLAKNSSS